MTMGRKIISAFYRVYHTHSMFYASASNILIRYILIQSWVSTDFIPILSKLVDEPCTMSVVFKVIEYFQSLSLYNEYRIRQCKITVNNI